MVIASVLGMMPLAYAIPNLHKGAFDDTIIVTGGDMEPNSTNKSVPDEHLVLVYAHHITFTFHFNFPTKNVQHLANFSSLCKCFQSLWPTTILCN